MSSKKMVQPPLLHAECQGVQRFEPANIFVREAVMPFCLFLSCFIDLWSTTKNTYIFRILKAYVHIPCSNIFVAYHHTQHLQRTHCTAHILVHYFSAGTRETNDHNNDCKSSLPTIKIITPISLFLCSLCSLFNCLDVM